MFRLCHRLWSGGDPPGVDEFREVDPVIHFDIPAAVLWVDHVLFHTGIYESARSRCLGSMSREILS